MSVSDVAKSQENNVGYVPPSMFEDLTPPMVRPDTKTGNIVEPKVSRSPETKPPIAPKPMPPKMSSTNPPILTPPPQKPVVPSTPNVIPPRVKPQSVITGPQAMPALPAVDVDKQVTFKANEEDRTKEPTIFERQQKMAQEKLNQEKLEKEKKASKEKDLAKPPETLMPVVAVPKNTSNPVEFNKNDQGALKRIIPFEAGQIALPAETTNSLAAGVVLELDKDDKKDWRVQIKSFATPHGTGISSDRRIALSRALSLRSSLITQGVAANKIDVLAEGLTLDGTNSGDRIDLYLYAPSSR